MHPSIRQRYSPMSRASEPMPTRYYDECVQLLSWVKNIIVTSIKQKHSFLVLFKGMNHDVLLCILQFCDVDTLANMFLALPAVRCLIRCYPNIIFQRFCVQPITPHRNAFQIYFQELCTEFVDYMENAFNIKATGIKKYIYIFTSFGQLPILLNMIDVKGYTSSIWKALLRQPSSMYLRMRSHKNVLKKLPNFFIKTGCYVDEHSLVTAILCSDKQAVKSILALHPDLSVSENASKPFLFILVEQYTLIETRLTNRRREYVWSMVALLRKNGAMDQWKTVDQTWSLTAYHHHCIENSGREIDS